MDHKIRIAVIKKLTRNSFLLSVIFHLSLLLFLLSISTIITLKPIKNIRKPPQLYVPSYVYQGAITPVTQPRTARHSSNAESFINAQNNAQNMQKTPNKASILASEQKNLSAKKSGIFSQKSILDMSRSIIQQNQVNAAINNLNNTEPPILLIGDKHAIVDPLIKLLGKSLSAHFHYPRIEGIFGAKGRVYVELVLHPEGYFSDVQIVQSSEIQDFNAAALYAVNTAPTVVGANKFLPKAKRFVVGFIFD